MWVQQFNKGIHGIQGSSYILFSLKSWTCKNIYFSDLDFALEYNIYYVLLEF